MQRTRTIIALLAAAALGAAPAGAQLATGSPSAAPSAAQTPRGPMLSHATLSPRLEQVGNVDLAPAAAARRPFGTSQTLMIVGGAAVLAGAIIGGDAGTVMIVGGAGVGLYGLYLFLREPPRSGSPAVAVGYRLQVGS